MTPPSHYCQSTHLEGSRAVVLMIRDFSYESQYRCQLGNLASVALAKSCGSTLSGKCGVASDGISRTTALLSLRQGHRPFDIALTPRSVAAEHIHSVRGEADMRHHGNASHEHGAIVLPSSGLIAPAPVSCITMRGALSEEECNRGGLTVLSGSLGRDVRWGQITVPVFRKHHPLVRPQGHRKMRQLYAIHMPYPGIDLELLRWMRLIAVP